MPCKDRSESPGRHASVFEFEKEFSGILRELRQNGALEHLVLVGSWCLPVYREHYPIGRFSFTTSDVDFSVRRPRDFRQGPRIPLHESLTRLGYVPRSGILSMAEKYIPAPDTESNSLSIEFLCEPGRDLMKPRRLPGLGIAVSPLPYQKVLLEGAIELDYHEVPVKLPRPATWAAHKIAVSQLQEGKDREFKMIKDLENALIVLTWLGKKALQSEVSLNKGKFEKLFQDGFKILEEKYEI